MYQHWFVSRQKRQLTTILPALIAFSDVCLGKKWSGNHDLQFEFEDELQKRNITEHGKLRARKAGQGGGGIRTLFKQLKDLGLVFTEDDNGLCRLTLIGEELVKGNITFVDAMRKQLQKYQYPSASVWSGSGSVDHSFKIHPFQFMFRLLKDDRLGNKLTMEEMQGIVIHHAKDDSDFVFEKVVMLICENRKNGKCENYVEDTDTKTYSNIANTFFNYINLTQYIERGNKTISIRGGKEAAVDEFIESNAKFIPNPELQENYIRAYGKGNAAKDLRNFNKENIQTKRELEEARIRKEYVLTALKTPITGITEDIIKRIVLNTGIDEKTVEKFLLKNYPNGNVEDFFVSYKELANMGQSGAKDFEVATCEMFEKIFNMTAKHVGPKGNTPDVFVESRESNYCGIVDNKAYKNGYSITGNHLRVMEDVYIPKYKEYGETALPLEFFSYVAGSFKKNIDAQVRKIHEDTGINGSAMTVDLLIRLAQDYADKNYTHKQIKYIFSVNREVRLEDINSLNSLKYIIRENGSASKVAEEK